MEVTEVKKDGLKRSISVTMPAAELEEKIVKKLSEVQSTYTIKGFRKGKVPLPVLQQRLGDNCGAEILNETVKLTLSEHLRGADEKPVVQPAFSTNDPDWTRGSDLEGTITYEVMPEIPDIDFRTIKVEAYRPTTDDNTIDQLLEKYSRVLMLKSKGVGQPAQVGDIVCVRVVQNSTQDPEQETLVGTAWIELGKEGKFCTFAHEEFINRRVNDKILIPVRFMASEDLSALSDEAYPSSDAVAIYLFHKPLDFYAKQFSGQEVQLVFEIIHIFGKTDPVVDDNMAKTFGADNLEDLRTQAITGFEKYLSEQFQNALRKRLRRQLEVMLNFEVPDALVSRRIAEINSVINQDDPQDDPDFSESERDELAFELPVQMESEPEDRLSADKIRDLAERQTRVSLVLSKVAAASEITLSDHEIASIVDQISREWELEPEQVRKTITQNPEARHRLARLLDDKTLLYLLEVVTVKELQLDGGKKEKMALIINSLLQEFAVLQGLEKLRFRDFELHQRVFTPATIGISFAVLADDKN